MNCREALAMARGILGDNRIEDAFLESEILLRHVLDKDRSQLYSDLDADLTAVQAGIFKQILERRRRGEPSAYITGHREFFGLDFTVDSGVLIPRPESELLVEKALELARDHRISTIADIGTGSGAIAVSLAVNLPGVSVYATDVSPAALEVARGNARRQGVVDRVVFLRGNLLEPLLQPVDMIVANLPYVRERDLPPDGPLRFEPVLALDGGKDGLDIIKPLCRQAREKLTGRGILLLEIGEGQADGVTAVLRETFPSGSIDVHRDLAGSERAVVLRLT